MKIFPAIDLRDGKVVRLFQGDYDQMTVFGEDPPETAAGFAAAGSRDLHVVDLDGAKDGSPRNFETIRAIIARSGLLVQVGGGIRDEDRIVRYLEAGAARVILGTAAVRNFDFTAQMAKKYGEKIAVGVDARDGKVAVAGWLETSGVDSFDLCRRLAEAGVQTVIYTDIACDGASKGTNLAAYRRLRELPLQIVASGGISSTAELDTLEEMGTWGAIVGKALYTGALDLRELTARYGR